MTVKNKYDIKPNTNIIRVLENSGYSLSTAIADIVDNCIDAKANNIWIDFIYDGINSRIIIKDDGFGMDKEAIINASIYAYRSSDDRREDNSLGKYSLGLKSATSSFADKLFIQSKRDEINTMLLDFKQMKESKLWYVNEIEDYQILVDTKTGTAIIWEDIKFMLDGLSNVGFYEKLEEVAKHLSHIFGQFINEGILNIYANGNIIKGWDPFLKNNPKTITLPMQEILIKDEVIEIETYILPSYSTLSEAEKIYVSGHGFSDQQGFYLYRNKRLIVEGGWLNLPGLTRNDKCSTARIKMSFSGEADEYFNPDFKKSFITIPDVIKRDIINIAKTARKKSRENYEYTKNPKAKKLTKIKETDSIWNIKNSSNGSLISINEENEYLQELTKNLTKKERGKLFSIITKCFPYSEMHRVSHEKLSVDEYSFLIKEYYDTLVLENTLDNNEILNKIAKTEPFSMYKEWLYNFIDENEG